MSDASHRITAGPVRLELPDPATVAPVRVAAIASVLTFKLRWPVLRVLAVSAALGLAAAIGGLDPA